MIALPSKGSRLAAVAALLVVASACGGPRTPVAVGVKEFPTDVLFGTKEGNLTPLRPSPIRTNPVIQVPRTPYIPLPPDVPSPVACPSADPLSAPKQEATNRATVPPVARSYIFRTTGSVTIDGVVQQLPEEAIRTVQNVKRIDQKTFTFEVLDELGTLKTLHKFRVVQESALETATKGDSGIFLDQTVRGDGNDAITTYTWSPPITLVRFPIEHGDSWNIASTALGGKVAVNLSAQIGVPEPDPPGLGLSPQILDSKIRVDACGEYLDAWNIQMSGQYVADNESEPQTVLSLMEGYAIAPQYGGIVVMEKRSASGGSDGSQVASERESTINVLPALPEE